LETKVAFSIIFRLENARRTRAAAARRAATASPDILTPGGNLR
jgi:hypothetical protein